MLLPTVMLMGEYSLQIKSKLPLGVLRGILPKMEALMFKILPSALALSVALIGINVTVAHAQPKSCPPGLAAKNNGCLPPGLAKRYTVGKVLPEGVYYQLITDLAYYGLDTPNGNWLYYLVDGDVLRIADDVFTVLEAFEILFGSN